MGNSRNLTVGLFVASAVVAFMALTIWISGKGRDTPMDPYSVIIESDVSGLALGGPVFYLGVQVGEVTQLEIVPGNPAGVRVDIRVQKTAPVDSGTWATLAAQGITGVSVINLMGEAGEHAPLLTAQGRDHPVIPFRDTGFSALLSSAPAVLDRIGELLDSANQLLSPENQANVASALSNVESLAATLAAQDSTIAKLPVEIQAALVEVRALTGQLQTLVKEAQPSTQAAINNLESATAQLAGVAGQLNDWLDRHDADVAAFAGDGLSQVPGLLSDARKAINEMEKLLEELRDQPSRAIYRTASDAIEVEP